VYVLSEDFVAGLVQPLDCGFVVIGRGVVRGFSNWCLMMWIALMGSSHR
jgi:hypothetical protein